MKTLSRRYSFSLFASFFLVCTPASAQASDAGKTVFVDPVRVEAMLNDGPSSRQQQIDQQAKEMQQTFVDGLSLQHMLKTLDLKIGSSEYIKAVNKIQENRRKITAQAEALNELKASDQSGSMEAHKNKFLAERNIADTSLYDQKITEVKFVEYNGLSPYIVTPDYDFSSAMAYSMSGGTKGFNQDTPQKPQRLAKVDFRKVYEASGHKAKDDAWFKSSVEPEIARLTHKRNKLESDIERLSREQVILSVDEIRQKSREILNAQSDHSVEAMLINNSVMQSNTSNLIQFKNLLQSLVSYKPDEIPADVIHLYNFDPSVEDLSGANVPDITDEMIALYKSVAP